MRFLHVAPSDMQMAFGQYFSDADRNTCKRMGVIIGIKQLICAMATQTFYCCSHICVVFGMAISKTAHNGGVRNFLFTYQQRVIVLKYLSIDHALAAGASRRWIFFLGPVS